ncbi:hypothetical protein [Aquabacterium sp.]|uniref:hypothetical protein n=1 Tax=Aquabacterium sp. TaxID=1872578 RepID=UPI003782E0A6
MAAAVPAADRKPFSSMQASAALAGFTVEAIEADQGGVEYIVSRWAMTVRCTTLRELAALLRRMGVAVG